MNARTWVAIELAGIAVAALVFVGTVRVRPPYLDFALAAAAVALTPERIVMALDRHGGNQERAWRELGLSSRDALYRLMKKHGILAKR